MFPVEIPKRLIRMLSWKDTIFYIATSEKAARQY
jgi:hypothetical protein